MNERQAALIQKAIDIVDDCDFAMFAEVVKAFPEVTGGDFPPDASYELKVAIETALIRWLRWNHPEFQSDE